MEPDNNDLNLSAKKKEEEFSKGMHIVVNFENLKLCKSSNSIEINNQTSPRIEERLTDDLENEQETKLKDKAEIEGKDEKFKKKWSLENFEIIRKLGKGSYAKVSLAKNIKTGELFAIKEIEKYFVEKV